VYQLERIGTAAVLVVVATVLVSLGYLTGAEWTSYTQWVIGFMLAHHAVTSAVSVAATRQRGPRTDQQ
jgi:hypothetical protein